MDEPTTANLVLQLPDGAIVDVGGATIGIAIVRHGRVVSTATEPTGGTRFSLVVVGSQNLSFEEAQALKNPARGAGTTVPVAQAGDGEGRQHHLAACQRPERSVDRPGWRYLGFSEYGGGFGELHPHPGMGAAHPLYVTPLGIALHDMLQ